MDNREIEKYLKVGNTKSVCIDIRELPDLGGLVRTITIRSNEIWIDFDSHGYEEGGIYYRAKYQSLEEVIPVLENFLNKRMKYWENFESSGNYPEKSLEYKRQKNIEELIENTLPKELNWYRKL